MKAWELAGAEVKDNAWLVAVTGQSLLRGIQGMGISTSLSRNWIVLLHRIVISIPHEYTLKSALVSCLLGSNLLADKGNKCDFRNIPKKATKQTAQKDESRLLEKCRVEYISIKMLGVMGNFCRGGEPFTLLIPVSNDLSAQLSRRGFWSPNSLCKMPIIFK